MLSSCHEKTKDCKPERVFTKNQITPTPCTLILKFPAYKTVISQCVLFKPRVFSCNCLGSDKVLCVAERGSKQKKRTAHRINR